MEEFIHESEKPETTETSRCVLESKIQSMEKDLAKIKDYFSVPLIKMKLPPTIYMELKFPIEGSNVCFHSERIKIRSYSAMDMLLNEAKFLSDSLVRYKKELEELK